MTYFGIINVLLNWIIIIDAGKGGLTVYWESFILISNITS